MPNRVTRLLDTLERYLRETDQGVTVMQCQTYLASQATVLNIANVKKYMRILGNCHGLAMVQTPNPTFGGILYKLYKTDISGL